MIIQHPVISVLMPCYNSSRWLDEAIQSVLRQTFRNFEFIIVNDGSTDNSAEIISSYKKKDDRIIVIHKDNSGISDSLNIGIQQARGEWIARIDADDICEATRLEKQIEKARNNYDIVFIGTGMSEIDENGTIYKKYRYPKQHKYLVRNLSTSRKFPPHSSAFYRTDVVRKIGGYRKRIIRSQDWDLWLRLAEVGQLFAIDEYLVTIRRHSSQVTNKYGRQQKIYSKISIISWWIRRFGFPDPVDSDDETFYSFQEWVATKLDEKYLFEYSDYIDNIKQKSRIVNSPIELFSIARYIIKNYYFLYMFLYRRLLGEYTSKYLAIEWIKGTL